jgi:hypothetical protein
MMDNTNELLHTINETISISTVMTARHILSVVLNIYYQLFSELISLLN